MASDATDEESDISSLPSSVSSALPEKAEKAEKSATAKVLEERSIQGVRLTAAQQWHHPYFREYLAPGFKADVDHGYKAVARDREGWFGLFDQLAAKQPEYDLDVLNVSADVDEARGRAKVWLWLRVIGNPPSIQRESISIMTWKRVDDRWMCYKHQSIRGAGGFFV